MVLLVVISMARHGIIYCLKYQNPALEFEGTSGSRKIKYVKRGTSTEYNNWIIYRMTEVMLIKGVDTADFTLSHFAAKVSNRNGYKAKLRMENGNLVAKVSPTAFVVVVR